MKVKSVSPDKTGLDVNEKVLKQCFDLYTDKAHGLVTMGKSFGLDIPPPSKQIVVLLLGNHSAGKSTFINWYVGENIQKAGTAVETQGFSFVQHGRRRESLLAEAALMSLPTFQSLKDIEGLLDFVTMEISSSHQREFRLVTLIDSPGLVDGGLKYPFDVDQALLTLGTLADLVLVFFDPIGQALCRRTLNIVRRLSAARKDGIMYLLSKVDETGSQADCQKVMVQMVQELCSAAEVNRQGFEIKSIHIPGMARGNGECVNQIEELCAEIARVANLTVQRTLNRLGNDCVTLENHISRAASKNQFKLPYRALLSLSLSFVGAVSLAMDIQDGPRSYGFGKETAANDSGHSIYLKAFLLVAPFLCFAHFSNLQCLLHWGERMKLNRMKRAISNASVQRDAAYSQYLAQSLH